VNAPSQDNSHPTASAGNDPYEMPGEMPGECVELISVGSFSGLSGDSF
jgi:hypothetical protein